LSRPKPTRVAVLIEEEEEEERTGDSVCFLMWKLN